MILLLDNYDSFTHNLAQALGSLGAEVEVARPEQISVREVQRRPPRGLVVSPGPGRPHEARVALRLIRRLEGRLPILGVCLGMQCIAVADGARVVRAARPVHGKTSRVRHDGTGILRGLPSPLEAMRYHSLVVDPGSLPEELVACAWSDDDAIMALYHRDLPVTGVQFHPESYRTPQGPAILANWWSAL